MSAENFAEQGGGRSCSQTIIAKQAFEQGDETSSRFYDAEKQSKHLTNANIWNIINLLCRYVY